MEKEKETINGIFNHLDARYIFNSLGDENTPTSCGIYMLGEKVIPYCFEEEVVYLLKVGKGKNLKRRLASYRTANPMAHCISYQETTPFSMDILEKNWIDFLSKKYPKASYGDEWFILPKEDFDYYCKHGFNNHTI